MIVCLLLLTFSSLVRNQEKLDELEYPQFSPPAPNNWNISQSSEKPGPSKSECERRIYEECNYPTTFTEEELENVRQYLNYSFSVLADIKPEKPLCPEIHVRHDWKCLTQQQRRRVVKTWETMYRRGDVQRLAEYHINFWPAWHKAGQESTTHRWLINQFEMIMRSIDPGVTLPYWESMVYGAQPERSIIWDVLGHSGNYSKGYCVTDGIYGKLDLIHCIKRHWTPRDTIYPWFTSETGSSYMQTATTFSGFDSRTGGDHFQVHVNIGGYEGQYSGISAPYDVIFYLHHMSRQDNLYVRWQLQQPDHLTPLSYNQLSYDYDPLTGDVRKADIYTDFIQGLPGPVSVRETFWIGFGDLCYISDQLVKPINRMWKQMGTRAPDPTALKRIKALPEWIQRKYFPVFLSGNYSEFHYNFEEVGDCNRPPNCLRTPYPPLLAHTGAGRSLLNRFAYDNGEDTLFSSLFQQNYQLQFLKDLEAVGYCSPYITAY